MSDMCIKCMDGQSHGGGEADAGEPIDDAAAISTATASIATPILRTRSAIGMEANIRPGISRFKDEPGV